MSKIAKGKLAVKVYEILYIKPETRDNDMLLYIETLKEFNLFNNIENASDLVLSLSEVQKKIAFESVSRMRRKLQNEDRELGEYKIQSSRQLEKIRRSLEKEYKKEYSSNVHYLS